MTTGTTIAAGLTIFAVLCVTFVTAPSADGQWQLILEFPMEGNMPDIAVDSRGEVYGFTDGGLVQVFSPQGEFLREFSVPDDAHGIAIDEDDVVYVLSRFLVSCYSRQGQFIRRWDCSLGQGDLGMGRGIDVRDGVVCVSSVATILRFSTEGDLLTHFPQSANWRPVFILPDGSIWALNEFGFARHYSADGETLDEWPTAIPPEPESNPRGLAIDSSGRLFLADNYGRVKVFLPSGALDDLMEISLHIATTVALDGDNTLYVGTVFPSGVMKFVYTPVAVEATTWGGIKSQFR